VVARALAPSLAPTPGALEQIQSWPNVLASCRVVAHIVLKAVRCESGSAFMKSLNHAFARSQSNPPPMK
jgi:hypothetical protein